MHGYRKTTFLLLERNNLENSSLRSLREVYSGTPQNGSPRNKKEKENKKKKEEKKEPGGKQK